MVGDLAPDGFSLGSQRQLTGDQNTNEPASWTADSQSVIFRSERGGIPGIYKQGLDGSSPRLVFSSPNLEESAPRLSPDGRLVIFSGDARPSKPGAPSKVYRLSVDGGIPEPLFEVSKLTGLSCTGRAANFCTYSLDAADRREISFMKFDPMGGPATQLTRVSTEPQGRYNWSLAPDGSQIAMVETTENKIRLIQIPTGKVRAVTVESYTGLHSPKYTPDSKSLYLGGSKDNAVWAMRVDLEGHATPVARMPTYTTTLAIPSPDGRHLAFRSMNRDANVWMIENF